METNKINKLTTVVLKVEWVKLSIALIMTVLALAGILPLDEAEITWVKL